MAFARQGNDEDNLHDNRDNTKVRRESASFAATVEERIHDWSHVDFTLSEHRMRNGLFSLQPTLSEIQEQVFAMLEKHSSAFSSISEIEVR